MTNIELLHEISATIINICINLMRIYQKHAQTLCKIAFPENGCQSLFSPDGAAEYDAVMSGIGQDQLRLVGPDLIYGRLFDRIGFGAVRTSDYEIFKSLVVTRLYRPGSKLRTLRYMAYFMNIYYDEDRIYRYLDELCHRPGAGRKAGV